MPPPLLLYPPPVSSTAKAVNPPSATSRGKPLPSNSIPTKPKPFRYSLSILVGLPRRLFRPPNARKTAGSRWTVAPEMDVSLEDILAMRHISPLSLKDFEQYLLFEEYGAENLYFVLWLKDYTARYNANATPVQLSLSIARARATFFSADSQYELNLAASRIGEFLAAVGTSEPIEHPTQTPSPSYPHPSDLTTVFDDVEHMLRISARRFVRARTRNASYQRALCVTFGVTATLGAALAPCLVSIYEHKGRWLRLGMFPPLWLGLTMVTCALNGLCFVVYLMGGSRQLYPFELHRPPISAPMSSVTDSLYEPSFVTTEASAEVKLPAPSLYSPTPSTASFEPPGLVAHGFTDENADSTLKGQSASQSYVLPEIKMTNLACDIFEFETAGFIPARDLDTTSLCTQTDLESAIAASSTTASSTLSTTSPRNSSPKLIFDFDSLPAKTLDSKTGPSALRAARGHGIKGILSAVFAPLTHIESPVVSRAQWEVLMRSSVLAFFIALIITSILVAVPLERY
ncbi:transmembrane protein [Ceratobasidium sp. AG-Ba]|nr:transmembrane protein [Ceratobasidium sp. AG-Ba]